MNAKTLEFLPVKGRKGIYYDLEFQPETLNVSGALAIFCPTQRDLDEMKHTLVENMQHVVESVKAEHPAGMDQDQFDQWYLREFGIGRKRMPEPVFALFMEIRSDMQKLEIERRLEPMQLVFKRVTARSEHLKNPGKRQSGVTEHEIERAREHPIQDLLDTRVFKATGKWIGVAHCPMPDHKENTPSFYIDKGNRYKCFGCGAKGDAIQLVMDRDGARFTDAVRRLNK